jgi:predicted DNA-binding transcriptional regulator AlpA
MDAEFTASKNPAASVLGDLVLRGTIAKELGLRPGTIARFEKRGMLPKAIPLSGRLRAYYRKDVQAFLDARIAAARELLGDERP